MESENFGKQLGLFEKAERQRPRIVLLPHEFDMQCRTCNDGILESAFMPIRTRQKPFAILRCAKCPSCLYLFGDIKDPLIVESRKFQGSTTFSEDIDRLFEERAADRERKAKRSQPSVKIE